jgi:hypothetical protein
LAINVSELMDLSKMIKAANTADEGAMGHYVPPEETRAILFEAVLAKTKATISFHFDLTANLLKLQGADECFKPHSRDAKV